MRPAMIVILAIAETARAMVAGGSGPRPDCYSEFDGITVTNPGGLPPRVECTDGDPACDAGLCGDGFCVFRIRLCVNQNDPDDPICRPPVGGLTSLRVLPRRFSDLVSGLDLRRSACGDFVDVAVEVRRGIVDRPGRMPLRVLARAAARPSTDKDQVFLVCNPRPAGTCSTDGTTTTTTPPTTTTSAPPSTTSTTSTSLPAATSTTTTSSSSTTIPPSTTTTSTTLPSPTTTTTLSTTTTVPSTTTTTTLTPTTTTSPPTTTTVPPTTTTTLATTTTLPIGTTTTSTTLASTTTTTTVPTVTTTLSTTTSSTTSSTVVTTTTSSTSSTVATTSTTVTTSTTPPSTTTTTTTTSTTTTTTTSTTTTTTLAGLSSCPAGGKVDVKTTLVPGPNTFNSALILGLQIDLTYPSAVSMPGTQFLPVDDPSDPATLIALLSADFSGVGINLYDGSPSFFDKDSAAPLQLKTLLTLSPTANLLLNQTVPFERARFSCTPGAALSAASFTCTIPSEVDVVSRTIPENQRPACVVTLSAP